MFSSIWNQSPAHRAMIIFGLVIVGILAFEKVTRGKSRHGDLVIGAVVGAAATETLKAFAKTQGAQS